MPPESWILIALLAAPQAPAAPPPEPPTAVVEAGASHHHVWAPDTEGIGPWRSVQASVAWQPPLRLRPVFDIERQTRPSGAHWRASAAVYVDWSPSFYSYQSIAIAPTVPEANRFYPSRRFDVRGFWKLPQRPNVVLAGGYTTLTFGPPQRSHIVNAGALLYGAGVITQLTLYLNRNQPGSLDSAAGNVAVQVGAEGRGWYGVSLSGGRELYRLGTLGPVETADFKTATVGGFVRQWLTANSGFHGMVEYQRVLGSYSRVGVTGRWFIGF